MKNFPDIEDAFCPHIREEIVLHVRSCSQCRAGMEKLVLWAESFKMLTFLVKDALKGKTLRERVKEILAERYGIILFMENQNNGKSSQAYGGQQSPVDM